MAEPDYDILVNKLRSLAIEKGGDPNDVGRLTRVAMKYAKNTNRELDSAKINDALFKAANIDPTTGQAPLPEETWGQTASTALQRGANAALQTGNAVLAVPELIASKFGYELPQAGENSWSPASNFYKRVDEQRAIDAERANREQSLAQLGVGEIGAQASNPLNYVGGGAGVPARVAAQGANQFVDRIRQGAVANEDNLVAKGLVAGVAGAVGARNFGSVASDALVNLGVGGSQEVVESAIDNREIDPTSLAVGAAAQLGQSAGSMVPNVIHRVQDGRKTAQLNLDQAQVQARAQADAIAAERAQAASDRRLLEHAPLSFDQVGVDTIRGADVLPDPLSEGVLPARDAIELNKLRDEVAQQELDAEQIAATQKLEQERLASVVQQQADAEALNAKTVGKSDVTIDDVKQQAQGLADVARTVVSNRQLGRATLDAAMTRLRDWRKQSIDNIAQGNGPLAPPKIDDLLGVPSERNVQVENADMQARQAAESAAVRPLREANAEVNTATLSAEIARLRAENEALRKPRVTAEQQAIDADKALAAGEAAVAPDRQMIANADKAIRRAEYDTTGKTSRVPVAESAPTTTPVVEPAKAVETPKAAETKTVPEGKAGAHTVYHGTSKAEFQNLDPYIGEYGLFGGGTYWTNDPNIAKEYTTKGKGKSPGIYESTIDVKNPLDMDKPADVSKWKSVLEGDDFVGQYVDLDGVTTNESVLRRIEDAMGDRGDISRGDAQELVQDFIVKMGHDSITHVGGGRHASSKGTKHRVYITFDPEQVKTTRKLGDTSTVATEAPRAEVQPTPVATEPVSRPTPTEAPSKPVTAATAEVAPKRQFFADDTAAAGYREVSDRVDPKFYEGKQLVDLDWIRANDPKGAKRADRLERQGRVQLGRTQSRSGATSIPSMIADATVDLAKSVVPSMKKIAETAGDVVKLPARFLAMDSKFNLDKASAERIRQLEENTFRILDKHRDVIEKANKATSFDFNNLKLANKLRDAINVPDSATGTSYRSDFLDMVEGRKPVTPELKPIVDAIWETNRATRQMAVDNGVAVGKGFRNGVGMVRFWNSDIVNRIANDGVKDPLVKTLFEDIAAKNNIPLGVVIDHFDKSVVIRDIGKVEAIAKLDPQELARMFDYVPSHIKGPDGEWHPVLNMDPNSYVNRVTQTSTKRAAAKASFPDGIDKFMSDSKLSPGEKKEMASAIADFYGIYERGTPDAAFNHAKMVDFVTNATLIINNARLSASHAANITELTSMSMVAPPQYMMKGGAKYEVGVGGLTEGRGANTLDVSNDSTLRGANLKVERILRVTGARKIPALVARRMYSGIQKFYSDINGNTSDWSEHYMEMADLSQDLRQKFRDGTATTRDIDVATTKAMRVATGRDLLGTQKAGMEHNWFARVLGPPYRGYSQKTIRNMWKATTQAFDVIFDPKIPIPTRAGIAASSIATSMISQGINAASYNALRAILAGSFAAALYELKDRKDHMTLQNFAWLTSNIIGGGPVGTLLEQSSKEGNVSLQSGAEMMISPYSAASAIYKAYTGGSIAEGASGMVPLVNKARKLASGEGKIEFAKNQFYRVMNEIEGRATPEAAEQTPLNAASKSLRNAIESGSGEQEALRELVAAAKLEAKTRRVDFNAIVYRKLDGMRTIRKYEQKLMASESPEDRKKLREMRSRIPDDIRRELIQFDRKVERLKLRFEPTE